MKEFTLTLLLAFTLLVIPSTVLASEPRLVESPDALEQTPGTPIHAEFNKWLRVGARAQLPAPPTPRLLDAGALGGEESFPGRVKPTGSETEAGRDLNPLGCVPHPPIWITENLGPAGFALALDPTSGEPIHRPGSGVVTGNGTAQNPFVIEGWCITASWYGITISNTDAHVVVRGNWVTGTVPDVPQANLIEEGIVIESAANVTIADNVVDFHDFGVVASKVDNASIQRNLILDNYGGLYIERASNTTVAENTISDNEGLLSWAAIAVYSDGIQIRENKLVGSTLNLGVGWSDSTVIVGNEVGDGLLSLSLQESSGARIHGNALGTKGLALGGLTIDHFRHDLSSNMVGGEPLHYIRDRDGVHVTSPAGQVLVVESANVTIEGVTSFASAGVMVVGSDNVDLSDSTLDGDLTNIIVWKSSGTTISGSSFHGVWEGLQLIEAQDTTVVNNTFRNHSWSLYLYRANHTRIHNNTIEESFIGAQLDWSSNVTLFSNELSANSEGLFAWRTRDIEAHWNNIQGNAVGVRARNVENPLDATHNWWGCNQGPSQSACDEAKGTVETAPNLTTAVPWAGAG